MPYRRVLTSNGYQSKLPEEEDRQSKPTVKNRAKIKCPVCGNKNSSGNAVCEFCYTRLKDEEDDEV